jgi:tRNA (mo5U34)-methyltransferase
MFDHRPFLSKFPLPGSLEGMSCLDVGTMDGFWAFEMERRGAAKVIALDLEDPDQLDWPVLVKPKVPNKALDESKAERFELIKSTLGSKVERVLGSVYDLDPSGGTFDLVFCGDLLLHLKDPISALEAIRSVTENRAIICTPVIRTSRFSKRPLVEFDGVDVFQWWLPNEEAFRRWLVAAGFPRVEMSPSFEVPLTSGKWRGLRGLATGYVR